jgi:hypothetical protein
MTTERFGLQTEYSIEFTEAREKIIPALPTPTTVTRAPTM